MAEADRRTETPGGNAHPAPLDKYILWGGATLLLIAVAGMSFDRARRLRFDFDHFYLDARYVWEHGALNPELDNPDRTQRRRLPFYLPVVPLLLAPLTAGGIGPAAAIWAAGQTLCVGLVLKMLARGSPARDPARRVRPTVAVACVLAAPAILEALKFNQLTFPVLALLLGALVGVQRQRPVRAGVLLGLATLVKLLPVLLALWLVLKRQWWALGAFVITVLLLVLGPPLLVFGPQRTMQYHAEWWRYNLHGPPARGMVADDVGEETLDDHFTDRRNQALPVVLARLFWPGHPHHVPFQPLTLSAATCAWLARGVLAILLVVLLWWSRAPWPKLAREPRQVEFAVYLLGMMVFAPLLRQYYLVWALPALVLFVRWASERLPGRRRLTGGAGMALWVLGMLLWLSEAARACGAHWLMLVGMGALLFASPAHGLGKTEWPRRAARA